MHLNAIGYFECLSACLKSSAMFKGVVVPKFVELIIFGDPFLIKGFNISDSLYDKITEFS